MEIEILNGIKYLTQHTSLLDVLASILAGLFLLLLRKWVRPLKEELTSTRTPRNGEETNPTIKDLLIDTLRATGDMRSKQEDYEIIQAKMVRTIEGVQKEVNSLNTRFDKHVTETMPIYEEIRNHMKLSNGKDEQKEVG